MLWWDIYIHVCNRCASYWKIVHFYYNVSRHQSIYIVLSLSFLNHILLYYVFRYIIYYITLWAEGRPAHLLLGTPWSQHCPKMPSFLNLNGRCWMTAHGHCFCSPMLYPWRGWSISVTTSLVVCFKTFHSPLTIVPFFESIFLEHVTSHRSSSAGSW